MPGTIPQAYFDQPSVSMSNNYTRLKPDKKDLGRCEFRLRQEALFLPAKGFLKKKIKKSKEGLSFKIGK